MLRLSFSKTCFAAQVLIFGAMVAESKKVYNLFETQYRLHR